MSEREQERVEEVLKEDQLAETLQLLVDEGRDVAVSDYALQVMRSHERLREQKADLERAAREAWEALDTAKSAMTNRWHGAPRRGMEDEYEQVDEARDRLSAALDDAVESEGRRGQASVPADEPSAPYEWCCHCGHHHDAHQHAGPERHQCLIDRCDCDEYRKHHAHTPDPSEGEEGRCGVVHQTEDTACHREQGHDGPHRDIRSFTWGGEDAEDGERGERWWSEVLDIVESFAPLSPNRGESLDYREVGYQVRELVADYTRDTDPPTHSEGCTCFQEPPRGAWASYDPDCPVHQGERPDYPTHSDADPSEGDYGDGFVDGVAWAAEQYDEDAPFSWDDAVKASYAKSLICERCGDSTSKDRWEGGPVLCRSCHSDADQKEGSGRLQNQLRQVEKIVYWQASGTMHPLTCGQRSDHPMRHGDKGVLYPAVSVDGRVVLVCPDCDYVQGSIPDVVSDDTPITERPDADPSGMEPVEERMERDAATLNRALKALDTAAMDGIDVNLTGREAKAVMGEVDAMRRRLRRTGYAGEENNREADADPSGEGGDE